MATATAPAAREIIADRVHGLMYTVDSAGLGEEPSDLRMNLFGMITDIAAQAARVHPDQVGNLASDITDEIEARILNAIAAGEYDE